jgi:hypothetical protein
LNTSVPKLLAGARPRTRAVRDIASAYEVTVCRDWVVLLMSGAGRGGAHVRDQLVPQSRQLELAHAIPGASVHTVDGDHFAAVRAPDAFVPELLAAVRRVGRSSPHRTHAATALAS